MIILLVLGMFAPRLVLVLLWIFTNLVGRAFHYTILLPLLGILFLPFTTLMYVLVYSPVAGSVVGANWIWVLLGFLVDLGAYYRARTPRATAA